jgi:glycosyl transferase family 87/WD40 repeat protein
MAREAEQAGVAFVGLFMPNPPPNALLLLPLAPLSPPAAKMIWTALLAASLGGAFLALRRVLAAPAWWMALAFLLPTTALANALAYGPPYALLVLLLALALLAMGRGRDWMAGLLLAPVVALKLYALALLPYFLWTRRWRAAAGLIAGTAAIAGLSLAVLGLPVHAAWLREMLAPSLEGRIIDPYSPFWQTAPAVARRLFQLEAELNPAPVVDRPALAAFLARALAVAVLGASVLAARRDAPAERVRREWAALLLASLAVSPMTASYHLVMLSVPCAILLADPAAGPRRAIAVLALLAFAASPLPHRFTPLASGWGNLLACPRLIALLALWAIAVAPLLRPAMAATAAALGLAAGATAFLQPLPPAPGERLAVARGPLLSEPLECEGRMFWIAPEPDHYVIAGDDGSRRRGDTARCVDGRLVALRAGESSGAPAWPRPSPDGRWVLYPSWTGRSWDVHARETVSGRVVVVAAGPDNETEPSWSADGRRVLFVSDWRRGLFGGAIYSVPFKP